MKEELIYVPHHKGIYDGNDIDCLHSNMGTFLIVYKDHMHFSEKCLIPNVPVIQRDYFGEC